MAAVFIFASFFLFFFLTSWQRSAQWLDQHRTELALQSFSALFTYLHLAGDLCGIWRVASREAGPHGGAVVSGHSTIQLFD